MSVDLRQRVREVLEQGYLMSLGFADGHGLWVADVIYVFDDELNLYWMSGPDARHSRAIGTHPQMAGTITVSGPGEDNFGIQFAGQATKVDGLRPDLVVKHFTKRHRPIPAPGDDVLDSDRWYRLTPDFFELIDERHFGFERQKVSLHE